MQKAGVVFARGQRRQGAAHHRHERVHRHQTADLVELLRAHHVEAEPAHDQYPRTQRQEWDGRRRMRRYLPVGVIAAATRPEQEHGGQRDPAAHRMHHYRAGEVVKGRAESGLQPCLNAQIAVPHNALEKRVDEGDDGEGGNELGPELGALGNAAGNDGGNGRGEGQQKEKAGQLIAMVAGEHVIAHEKMMTVGDAVAEQKVGNRRDGKVGDDFGERVDLVFLAHRAQLKKGEPGVHGEHQNGAEKDEQHISTGGVLHGWGS